MYVSRIIRPLGRTSFFLSLQNDIKLPTTFCYCHSIFSYTRVTMQYRPFFSLPGSNLTKEHSESKILGYSMTQMYDVVENVEEYKNFVPWCVASNFIQRSETHARADLEVGFPPVSEKYTSVLTLARPNLVKSECMDGTLFNYLTCVWKFSKGPSNIPNSCTLNFYISFEFKSALHSHLSTMFFEQVVVKMLNAFENRAKELYGPSSLVNIKRQPVKRRQQPRVRVPATKKIIIRDPK